jgi:hypothetical protein
LIRNRCSRGVRAYHHRDLLPGTPQRCLNARAQRRSVWGALRPLAGLVIWAAHFTAIYAVSAFACERGWAARPLFGLPWVAALVGIATVVALTLLAFAFRPALTAPRAPMLDGGEAEPQFTRWFAGSAGVLAALAVVFQALPVLLLPGCG